PTLRSDGSAWVGMTTEDRRNAAMMRAQAAEDDLAQRDSALAQRDSALAVVQDQRDAALARLDEALMQRDTVFARADAIQEIVTRLAGQIAELNAAISRKDKAETHRALASEQDAARRRFAQRVLQMRVLLGLLRRPHVRREAAVHAEAAALGI